MRSLRCWMRTHLFLALTCISAASRIYAIPQASLRGLRQEHNEAVSGPTRFSAILLGGRRDRRQPTDNEYGSRADTASTRRLTGLVARILASPPEEQDDAVGASARGARSRQPTGLPPPVPLARAESSRSAVRPEFGTGAGSVTYEGFGTARPPPPQVGVRALSGVGTLGRPRAQSCHACQRREMISTTALRLFLSAAAEAQAVREEMSRLIFDENRSLGNQSFDTASAAGVSARLRDLHEQVHQLDNTLRDYGMQRRVQFRNARFDEVRQNSFDDMRVVRGLQRLFAVHWPAAPRFGPLAAQGVAAPGQAPPPQGPGPPIPGVDPPQVVPDHLAQGPGAGPPQLGPGAAAAGQGPPLPGQGPPFPAQGPHPPRGHPPGPPQPGQNVYGLRPPRSPGSFNR